MLVKARAKIHSEVKIYQMGQSKAGIIWLKNKTFTKLYTV